MKSVLISIRPQWVEKIASGEKTIEVRKTRPKIETPFKCYIYCTKASVKGRYFVGVLGFNSDELYRTPHGRIKYGDSIELMACGSGNYSKDNFLNGKVIGEFVCDKVTEYIAYKTQKGSKLCKNPFFYACLPIQEMCLTIEQVEDYGKGKILYGWHISDLKIYDKPKELSEFIKPCPYGDMPCGVCEYYSVYLGDCRNIVTRPPQSYMEVEEL